MIEELMSAKKKIRSLQSELGNVKNLPYMNRSRLAKYLGISETALRDFASECLLFAPAKGFGDMIKGRKLCQFHPYQIRLIEALQQKLISADDAVMLWNDFKGELRESLKINRTSNIVPRPMKRGRKPKSTEVPA
jgi:hypothetical protein